MKESKSKEDQYKVGRVCYECQRGESMMEKRIGSRRVCYADVEKQIKGKAIDEERQRVKNRVLGLDLSGRGAPCEPLQRLKSRVRCPYSYLTIFVYVLSWI